MSKNIIIRGTTFEVSDAFADTTRTIIAEMSVDKPWTGFQDMLQRCFEAQSEWTLAEVEAVLLAFYPENKISLAVVEGRTEYVADRVRTDIRRFNKGQMPGQKETGIPATLVKVSGLPVGKSGAKSPAADGSLTLLS
jgi:hypothetical protein